MSLIRTKIKNKDIMHVDYYVSSIVPKGMIVDFVKGFLEEKLNATWLGQRYCELSKEKILNGDVSEVLEKLILHREYVQVVVSAYYYDSTNHTESSTVYAVRGFGVLSLDNVARRMNTGMSLFDALEIELGGVQSQVGLLLNISIKEYIKDPKFSLDKIRIDLKFESKINTSNSDDDE